MYTCFNSTVTTYKKQDIILLQGYVLNDVGIVLSGEVEISRSDISGNSVLIETLGKGSLFSGALLAAGVKENPFTITAATDCSVMRFNYQKITNPCDNQCQFHRRLINNFIKILGQKNLRLNNHFEIISKRTIRERVLTYLQGEALKNNSKTFTLEMPKTKLASYLSVNRSALERELSKMQKDKILTIQRAKVTLM